MHEFESVRGRDLLYDHQVADQRPTHADHGNRPTAFLRDAGGLRKGPGADVTAGTPKNNPQTWGSGAMNMKAWDGGNDGRKPGVVVSESPRVRRFQPKSASPRARSTCHEPRGSMDTSAAGILLSPVRMAPSSSFPLESPQHWSTPSSDSQERATQRFRSSTSRLFHTPKSPGQILHDPSFHPGRRCCYQLGANSAEAESARRKLADLFESWCFNSKDKFQVCLESCTHGRPAASLRNGLDALKDCEAHDTTEKTE